jgi:hypothetical protein
MKDDFRVFHAKYRSVKRRNCGSYSDYRRYSTSTRGCNHFKMDLSQQERRCGAGDPNLSCSPEAKSMQVSLVFHTSRFYM